MAKKRTKAKTTARKPAKKAARKPAAKKSDRMEIELGPAEDKALKLAHSSDDVCRELEMTVTLAIAQAVRKVFKQHDLSLTQVQAQVVSLLLFGD